MNPLQRVGLLMGLFLLSGLFVPAGSALANNCSTCVSCCPMRLAAPPAMVRITRPVYFEPGFKKPVYFERMVQHPVHNTRVVQTPVHVPYMVERPVQVDRVVDRIHQVPVLVSPCGPSGCGR
jgi:hypothetical protein